MMEPHFFIPRANLKTLRTSGLLLAALACGVWVVVSEAAGLRATLLPLLAFAVGIMILRWPFLGLVLLVALFPIQQLTTMELFSSASMLLGGLTLVAYLFQQRAENFKILNHGRWLFSFCLVFLFLIILSELRRDVQSTRLWSLTYLQLVIFVWLTTQLLCSARRTQILMYVFIAFSLISGFTSLWDYARLGGQYLRVQGLVGNANELALYMGVAICFSLYFLFNQKTLVGKLVHFSLICVLTFIILISGSRGGVLFVSLAAGYMIVRSLGLKKAALALLVVAMLIGIMVPLLPAEYPARYAGIPQAIIEQADTVGLRIDYWHLAIRAWEQSPLLGIGTGGYVSYIDSYLALPIGRRAAVPHNMYLTVLAEEGLIGLTVFMGILLVSAVYYLKADLRSQRGKRRIFSLVVAWESVFLLLLMTGVKGSIQYYKPLWLAFGLSAVLYRLTSLPGEDAGSGSQEAGGKQSCDR